jgi:hypothetical protein
MRPLTEDDIKRGKTIPALASGLPPEPEDMDLAALRLKVFPELRPNLAVTERRAGGSDMMKSPANYDGGCHVPRRLKTPHGRSGAESQSPFRNRVFPELKRDA